MRKRRRYYEPEDLGDEQDRRDAAIRNRRFYVYVLDTDHGHYVGHSAQVSRRLREHQDGQAESTAGSNPRLAWTSGPLQERANAASFEAALKSLRDQRAPRFKEITGLDPHPFRRTAFRPAAGRLPGRDRSRPGRSRRSRPRRYGRRRGGLGRVLIREVRVIFRSRRKRRMWGVIAVAVVLVVVYINNGGF